MGEMPVASRSGRDGRSDAGGSFERSWGMATRIRRRSRPGGDERGAADGNSPPQGFYDATGTGPAKYVLERVPGETAYLLKEQIRYVDGDGASYTVPSPAGKPFETDLTSIPMLAAWLVPKDGTHTPAALVHDAMIGERRYEGDRDVTEEEADDMFRRGMQHLGVRFIRRWLMWGAVS